MTCETLLQLLNTVGWENGNDTAYERRIVMHIRSCSQCQRGIAELSEELLARQALTCDQCRERFPAYYEATRPEYPLVEMSDVEMAEMLLHLGWCASCREEYEELVLLSELEERGEVIEP
jgi:hypothetical protein